ncbi:hypothetical protein EBR78_09715, partial [bacterium]|nr:hypothetical protein [bacterium]
AAVCLAFVVEVRNFIPVSDAPRARYIAAKRKLLPGMILSVHDLTVYQGKQKQDPSLDGFTDQQIHEVVGAEVLVETPEGELIQASHLRRPGEERFSKKVPSGLRAYSIQTDQTLPLQSGDKVDILGNNSENPVKPQVLVQNRKVLGARSFQETQQVLIAVSAQEATLLDRHRVQGVLSLILRNPEDESLAPQAESKIKLQPKKMIEIWSDSDE